MLKVKLNKEVRDFLYGGSRVTTKNPEGSEESWYYYPYWIRIDADGDGVIAFPEDLPEHLKNAIHKQRNP